MTSRTAQVASFAVCAGLTGASGSQGVQGDTGVQHFILRVVASASAGYGLAGFGRCTSPLACLVLG